jgi:Carboxypeptidase regulatory-like domain
MQRTRAVCIIGVAIGAIVAAACGQRNTSTAPTPVQTTYALSGVVNGSAGGTIPNAQVRILDSAGGADPTFTNADGAFNFAALGTGRHFVEISKAGYQTWENELAIVDRDLQISVTLISAARN